MHTCICTRRGPGVQGGEEQLLRKAHAHMYIAHARAQGWGGAAASLIHTSGGNYELPGLICLFCSASLECVVDGGGAVTCSTWALLLVKNLINTSGARTPLAIWNQVHVYVIFNRWIYPHGTYCSSNIMWPSFIITVFKVCDHNLNWYYPEWCPSII